MALLTAATERLTSSWNSYTFSLFNPPFFFKGFRDVFLLRRSRYARTCFGGGAGRRDRVFWSGIFDLWNFARSGPEELYGPVSWFDEGTDAGPDLALRLEFCDGLFVGLHFRQMGWDPIIRCRAHGRCDPDVFDRAYD